MKAHAGGGRELAPGSVWGPTIASTAIAAARWPSAATLRVSTALKSWYVQSTLAPPLFLAAARCAGSGCSTTAARARGRGATARLEGVKPTASISLRSHHLLRSHHPLSPCVRPALAGSAVDFWPDGQSGAGLISDHNPGEGGPPYCVQLKDDEGTFTTFANSGTCSDSDWSHKTCGVYRRACEPGSGTSPRAPPASPPPPKAPPVPDAPVPSPPPPTAPLCDSYDMEAAASITGSILSTIVYTEFWCPHGGSNLGQTRDERPEPLALLAALLSSLVVLACLRQPAH